VTTLIVVLSSAQFLAGMTFAIGDHIFRPSIVDASTTSFVFAVVADLTVTIALCLHLAQNMTGFAATDTVITKIILGLVQTGLLTTAVSAIVAGLFIGLPDTSLSAIAFFPLPKLYTVSLLSSLNMRSQRVESPLSTPNWSQGRHSTRIAVTREVHEFVSDEPRPSTDKLGYSTYGYHPAAKPRRAVIRPTYTQHPSETVEMGDVDYGEDETSV